MSGADVVSAVEGASAVLPCTFTDTSPDVVPSGSVIWYREKPGAKKLVFKCTYPVSGPSGCDTTTQEAGGGRFGFVGNLSRRDATIMVERLNRSDGGRYRCRVELNVGRFNTAVLTNLSVRAPNESVSVMTGTEGASATLPCVFTRPRQSLTAHTVTWMRKDPYRHIVTFRRIRNGSWAAEIGVTRYELVGDPELGNAWIRIKQLRVSDSHSYMCLAAFRERNHDDSSYVDPPYIHVIQSEIQLQVRPAPNESVSVMTGTEGASATLPCVFTRPRQNLTAHTVTWMRKDPYQRIVTFRRIQNGSWAAENGVTRYELVRDPELGNAWIRIKQLRVEDSHSYLCLAAFRKRNHDDSSYVKPPFIHVIQSEIQLQVTPAPSESVSVMTGTEGASATLPCVFTRPRQSLTAHTVTWMRKDPYRHIVTFRRIRNGSWAVENGVTRYELVGDPELENAWIRIKQLRVSDSHSYLCLAAFRERNHDDSSYVKPPFIHVIQSEIQLQVTPAPSESVSVMTGTEGASATLPCVFTRPQQSLTAHTVTWMRKDPYRLIVTFRHHGNGSWATENGVTRYELIEDPELGNAWIRIKQLRVEDSHSYLCLAEFRKRNHDDSSYVKLPFIHVFQSEIQLQVTPAPNESVSVMTGTEGASATLPCVFTRPPQSLTAHTVTWMRKDPYRHIVTFRHIRTGLWAVENRVTRYELVGDPELGNAWTRIKQLRVSDSHSYLCLAAFRERNHDYSSYVKPPFIHVIQSEIQLQVRPANSNPNSNSNSLIYVLVVLVLLLLVCVLLAVSWKKKVHIWLMGFIRGTKRNVPLSTRLEQEQKPPQSVQDSSPLYDNIAPSSNNEEQSDSFTYASIPTEPGKARKPQTEDQEQPDSCTYATILMRGEKASKPQAEDQGGQKQEAGPPEVIYAEVVKKQ